MLLPTLLLLLWCFSDIDLDQKGKTLHIAVCDGMLQAVARRAAHRGVRLLEVTRLRVHKWLQAGSHGEQQQKGYLSLPSHLMAQYSPACC